MNTLYTCFFHTEQCVHLVCHFSGADKQPTHHILPSIHFNPFLSFCLLLWCLLNVKYFSSFSLYSAEYMGLGYGDFPLLQFTLWFWVQWCAVVGLVWRHIPRETQTLVRPFRVNAFGILAQGHPVVQLVALIHICKKETSKDTCT